MTKPRRKRHQVGTGVKCWCGLIHYVNPVKTRNGTWKCGSCGTPFDDPIKAYDHAVEDHKRNLKTKGELV